MCNLQVCRYLQVPVHIQPIVLRREDHRAIIHEGYVETLSVLHLRLVGRHELAVLSEQCQVEVVMVVRDEDLSLCSYAHADRVVGDTFPADLTQILAIVVEYLEHGKVAQLN